MEGERKEKFQAEGSSRGTLRNCIEEREIFLQHELNEKITCPAEAEGLMQSTARPDSWRVLGMD